MEWRSSSLCQLSFFYEMKRNRNIFTETIIFVKKLAFTLEKYDETTKNLELTRNKKFLHEKMQKLQCSLSTKRKYRKNAMFV
jgi:hypothetical protein